MRTEKIDKTIENLENNMEEVTTERGNVKIEGVVDATELTTTEGRIRQYLYNNPSANQQEIKEQVNVSIHQVKKAFKPHGIVYERKKIANELSSEGLEPEEIAEEMGMSLETIRNYLDTFEPKQSKIEDEEDEDHSCVCGREFDDGRKLGGHHSHCDVYQKVKSGELDESDIDESQTEDPEENTSPDLEYIDEIDSPEDLHEVLDEIMGRVVENENGLDQLESYVMDLRQRTATIDKKNFDLGDAVEMVREHGGKVVFGDEN